MKNRTLNNLIELAQQESGPSVDVADNVLATLSGIHHRSIDPYRAYTWVGVASAAVAACVLIGTTLLWQANSDSVSEIITYVAWVTQ